MTPASHTLDAGTETLHRFPTITYARDETPPPPIYDTAQEQSCYDNGGFCNQSNCSCSFFEPPPDPVPEKQPQK